jgi:predicted nucleic acid-binding protein
MKGFDTSVLLALLEGDTAARELLRRTRGVELATTEANLLELALIARHGPAHSQRARREVLDRLRRKITVLPIDSRAVDHIDRHLQKTGDMFPPLVLAMMGALEAAGCDELFTRNSPQDLGKWKLKVSRIGRSHSKLMK